MNNRYQSDRFKVAIKTVLKNQKKTYENLAEHLQCSVPTVKRILGKEELGLTRLISIADYLGVKIAELEGLTEDLKPETFKFTPEQEKFLNENHSHFCFLMNLFSEKTPEKIAVEFSLDERSVTKYLLDLEKIDVISVSPSGDVKTRFSEVPDLGSGPFIKAYYEKFISTVSRFYIDWLGDQIHSSEEKHDEPAGFTTLALKLTPESYKEFVMEQQRRMAEWDRLSRFEQKSVAAEDLKTFVVTTGFGLMENDNPRLKELEKIWGPIEKIS